MTRRGSPIDGHYTPCPPPAPISESVDVDDPRDLHPSHGWRPRAGVVWLECARCYMRDYFPGANQQCTIYERPK